MKKLFVKHTLLLVPLTWAAIISCENVKPEVIITAKQKLDAENKTIEKYPHGEVHIAQSQYLL